MVIEDLAKEVMGDVKTIKAGLGVVDAIGIVVLLLRAVALAYECFELYPDKAVTSARNPSLLQRWYIHRKIKTALDALGNPLDYQEVYAGVLQVGKTVSVAQIQSAMAEIKAG